MWSGYTVWSPDASKFGKEKGKPTEAVLSSAMVGWVGQMNDVQTQDPLEGGANFLGKWGSAT